MEFKVGVVLAPVLICCGSVKEYDFFATSDGGSGADLVGGRRR